MTIKIVSQLSTEEDQVFAKPQQCISLELEILQEVLFDNVPEKKVQELKKFRQECGSTETPRFMLHLLEALAEYWHEDLTYAVFQTDTETNLGRTVSNLIV